MSFDSLQTGNSPEAHLAEIAKLSRGEHDDKLRTLLLDCAYRGFVDGVRAVLAKGISVDATDPATGMTALHIAVGRNRLQLARILVEHGASFVPDKFGRLPTTVAARCQVSDELNDFIAEAEASAQDV